MTYTLYCPVSNFLSTFSKYYYFNYFRNVWSTPAVGSELLILTDLTGCAGRQVYLFTRPQILMITFPSHPHLPRFVGNICGFCGFFLEAQKEISFPNLIKKRWCEVRPESSTFQMSGLRTAEGKGGKNSGL